MTDKPEFNEEHPPHIIGALPKLSRPGCDVSGHGVLWETFPAYLFKPESSRHMDIPPPLIKDKRVDITPAVIANVLPIIFTKDEEDNPMGWISGGN